MFRSIHQVRSTLKILKVPPKMQCAREECPEQPSLNLEQYLSVHGRLLLLGLGTALQVFTHLSHTVLGYLHQEILVLRILPRRLVGSSPEHELSSQPPVGSAVGSKRCRNWNQSKTFSSLMSNFCLIRGGLFSHIRRPWRYCSSTCLQSICLTLPVVSSIARLHGSFRPQSLLLQILCI